MAKNFCFTIFNINWVPNPDNFKYIIYQKEKCTTGNEHFQGYFQLAKTCRIPAAKRLLNEESAHIEPQKGTNSQARDYCRKEESRVDGPWEHGIFAEGAGKRTDLDRIAEMPLEDIIENHPGTYVKYHKGLKALRQDAIPKRTWKTEVHVYWGEPGTGKSRTANELAPNAYWKMPGSKWWDGYNGEDDVIIDDFKPDEWERDALLRLMDRYPLRVEYKGGSCEFAAKRLIITTNFDPENWMTPAIMRRVERVHKV